MLIGGFNFKVTRFCFGESCSNFQAKSNVQQLYYIVHNNFKWIVILLYHVNLYPQEWTMISFQISDIAV